ncbi:MAG: hypothetical protein CSA18_04350 [Deltaproteobacteria bacterium]|nr:MAG: hypothetical protein CSA18_04350 [Deltaproteobacteria bacterium]
MSHITKTAIMMVSIIFLFIQSASALTPLSESRLKNVTGQSGIIVDTDEVLGINFNTEKLLFTDSDGTNGTGAALSLNKIEFAGRVSLGTPVSINTAMMMDPFSDTAKKAIDINLNQAEIWLDRYHIESITIESISGPGMVNAGKSFGSITVEGFNAELSGNIRISSIN